ncbi:Serine/threonine-protein kinase KIC1 [Madurella mycetomatis]|uniref:Serine/threonine-protein kinase KIC1 n=1 Tax=Madurella mycetomatis TaxID=100816 RepID=A0A175WK90_9PEZI|nr:Serine/threonine-protein kinase KIC1 [Madurella mycetomatis]
MEDRYYTDEAETPLEPPPPAFLLAPVNPAARKAIELPENDGLRARVDDTIGLWIDFSNPEKQVFVLGCGETDIHLPNTRASSKGSPHISEVHASFRLVEETGAVLLEDHSEDRTVETMPHNYGYTIKLRSSSRSVLVARGINPRFSVGRDKWYQFKIQWQSDGLYAFPNKDEPYTVGPSNSRTKKYLQGDRVGGGSYGTVWWVLDVTNGKVMAVKKFHNLSGKNLDFATREVANLFRINQDSSIKHEHILQIFDYAGGGEKDNWGEIFMPLMKGNLKTLVEDPGAPDPGPLSDIVLRQMLLALQCIASHNIVHRDVKPENVLWEYDEDGNYRFCLGDFGLSNDPGLARTAAGTEPFMAPEVFNRQKQTTKVDIWSLFATIVWTQIEEFRKTCSHMRAPDLHKWLVSISKMDEYATIRKMASMDPKKRPSAKDQLAILDGTSEDFGSFGVYGSDSGDGAVTDLSGRFSSMRLQETPNLSYGSSSSGQVTSPELPYYEPYASQVMQSYLEEMNPAEQSKRYVPLSPDPGDSPRGHEGAWVRPYENPYGPAETEGSGSGTAVPENWTATALPLTEEPTYYETHIPRRRHKGKHKA